MTSTLDATSGTGFAGLMARHRGQRQVVLQPRMGFAEPETMARGLRAVKHAAPGVAGTLTLDSYTRTGDHDAARRALRDGHDLNGYPLVAHGPAVTRAMLDGIADAGFAVQVRHGSPRPLEIFRTLLAAGLDATEGGPVSYCLPYGRVPLAEAIDEWRRCCELLAGGGEEGRPAHLETFAGCMLGQLCPPSLLVALSVLEAMFFRDHGLGSVSLSYAQQTQYRQDVEAVAALRRLAGRYLPGVDWHVVVYTYMGVYPRTPHGAAALLGESVQLAVEAGADRVIVKTCSEGFKIPSIGDNVAALRHAASVRDAARAGGRDASRETTGEVDGAGEVHDEALTLIEAVLELNGDVGTALATAFGKGYLDVPFCLHPDNANRARSVIDTSGRLTWAGVGSMPLPNQPRRLLAAHRSGARAQPVTAARLLDMLSYNQRRFDGRAPTV